ncbi:MAG TPA: peptide ABC transporter substrate-binding protein [Acidimicrobiales bacterium]|nr:peptide ABC transporter substrate-binding protein [Acidimicrobiales bacterium]
MRRQRRSRGLLALVLGLSLVAAACGDDGEGGGGSAAEPEEGEPTQGGELVDLGTFVGDPPEFLDPGLNQTLDAAQAVNVLYDGLTEVDTSDPDNPVTVPLVAESFESNDDATVWTFTIRDGLKFSNGEDVLPSSFQLAWERASDPDFAGDYAYLFNFIDGGREKLDGKARTISGISVDDAAMTLTVTLDEPYANFPTVASFQTFFPMPKAVRELKDQKQWDRGMMVGNGPFMLEKERTDTEISLVPNPEWDGTKYTDLDLPSQPYLERLVFRVTADPDTSYNSFEAGEGDTAQIPAGRFQDAADTYATTLDDEIVGSYYYDINMEDPVLGGEEGKPLRQAIQQAIDRDEINEAVFEGIGRKVSNAVTPEGIPGWGPDLCDTCTYDPEAAKASYQEWLDAGHELTKPLKIQFNTGQNHDQVTAIIIDDLDAIGIDAEPQPMDQETYFSQLADGACRMCRAGWYADYPTYDNFMYDLFHSDSANGGNNYSNYKNPKFDALVDEAKATTDPDEQGELFRRAETMLLEDAAVIPINWYKGEYAYNGDKVGGLAQSPLGIIPWETVYIKQ